MPESGGFDGYNLIIMEGGSESTASINKDLLSYTAISLKEGTEYRFRIAAAVGGIQSLEQTLYVTTGTVCVHLVKLLE